MKTIVFTFDDGRLDNYEIAYPIMAKYHFCGTVYLTSGYIDSSWDGASATFKSSEAALSWDQIQLLGEEGWEIGLHGDQHKTNCKDWGDALRKMDAHHKELVSIGCSYPNSKVEQGTVDEILDSEYGRRIKYIRGGRVRNTKTLSSRLLYIMYRFFKMQYAFNRFNREAVFRKEELACRQFRMRLPSVVVRYEDDPQQILRFISQLPEESAVILMFHSILPENHRRYGVDPWNWSMKRFEILCKEISACGYEVKTMMELFEGI